MCQVVGQRNTACCNGSLSAHAASPGLSEPLHRHRRDCHGPNLESVTPPHPSPASPTTALHRIPGLFDKSVTIVTYTLGSGMATTPPSYPLARPLTHPSPPPLTHLVELFRAHAQVLQELRQQPVHQLLELVVVLCGGVSVSGGGGRWEGAGGVRLASRGQVCE